MACAPGWPTPASTGCIYSRATGIALLAAAYLVTEPGADDESEGRSVPIRVPGLAVRALVSVGIVVGAVVIGRSLLSVRYLDQGKAVLDANPVQAIQEANDALAFNGDSVQALYLKSAAYARVGDYWRSRGAAEGGGARAPQLPSWALLGDLAARRGELGEARGVRPCLAPEPASPVSARPEPQLYPCPGLSCWSMDARRQIPWLLLAATLVMGIAAAPVQARYSPKKAIWGPAYVNGVSQFPRYQFLGAGIFEAQVRWENIAPTRPANLRNPRDPAYRWPAELDRAVAEAAWSDARGADADQRPTLGERGRAQLCAA